MNFCVSTLAVTTPASAAVDIENDFNELLEIFVNDYLAANPQPSRSDIAPKAEEPDASVRVTTVVQQTTSLDETLRWIESRLDGERIGSPGIHIRTDFSYRGCNLHFTRTGGQVTLVDADLDLRGVTAVAVTENPVGTQWTGVFLTFHTAADATRVREHTLSAGTQFKRTFNWHLGSVRAGTSTQAYSELGQRLINAFSHAVKLCGGAIAAEPF